MRPDAPMPFTHNADAIAFCIGTSLLFLCLCCIMAQRDKRRWRRQDEEIDGKR